MKLPYIPARDPRHRSACLALYRALLKQVPDIVLPAERTSFPGDRVDPIRHLIRKNFRRNKNEDSQRLVVSTLSNGYKFLHLLHGAKIPASPEHKTVVDLIQRFKSRRKPPKPREELTPEPTRPPLLTRHANPAYKPDEWLSPSKEPRFFYTPTARPIPAQQLGGSGIRRVPYVAMTSHDSPFLRISKPQPPALGAALKRRVLQKQRWLDRRKDFEGNALWLAEQEDKWEDIVAGGRGRGADADGGATFVKTINESRAFIKRIEGLEYKDKLQRAAALDQIEREERELADAEAAAREESKDVAVREGGTN